jgi:hypothetical protein
MLKKYIIYSAGRNASTAYAQQLARPYFKSGLRDMLCHSAHDDQPDWSRAINHTHQLAVIRTAPNDYVKIIATRSLLDCAVSDLVGRATKQWHVHTDEDISKYKKMLESAQLVLDPQLFIDKVTGLDYAHAQALKFYNQCPGEKYVLEYNRHANNYLTWRDHLNLDPTLYPMDNNARMSKKLPVDKFTTISNLEEILDVYRGLYLLHDFDDAVTIKHIEQILKEKS